MIEKQVFIPCAYSLEIDHVSIVCLGVDKLDPTKVMYKSEMQIQNAHDVWAYSFESHTFVLVLAVWRPFLEVQLPAGGVPHSGGIKEKGVSAGLMWNSSYPSITTA